LDIGDGHVISVVRAEFNSSTTATNGSKGSAPAANTGNMLMDGEQPMLGSTLSLNNQSQNKVDHSEQGFHSHFVHSTSTHNDIGSRAQPHIAVATTINSSSCSTLTIGAANTNNILYTLLPVETEVGKYPVVLILNAFDPSNAHDDDPSFFDELEVKC